MAKVFWPKGSVLEYWRRCGGMNGVPVVEWGGKQSSGEEDEVGRV